MAAVLNSDVEEFKTISEVSVLLDIPQHVLRFWEGQFSQIKPVKRRGGRRFYSSKDVEIIEKIKVLLYIRGYTIKGAKQALNQNFVPIDDDMKKKDTRQIDLFEAGKTENTNKIALIKILEHLRAAQKLLKDANLEN